MATAHNDNDQTQTHVVLTKGTMVVHYRIISDELQVEYGASSFRAFAAHAKVQAGSRTAVALKVVPLFSSSESFLICMAVGLLSGRIVIVLMVLFRLPEDPDFHHLCSNVESLDSED